MFGKNRDWVDFLLNSTGRVSRWDYWIVFFLISFLITFISALVDSILKINFFYPISRFLLIYPQFMITIKRCHDRNKSGWFILVLFLPIILVLPLGFLVAIIHMLDQNHLIPMNFLVVFLMLLPMAACDLWFLIEMLRKGTTGPNRFGLDPLEEKIKPSYLQE